MSQGQNVTVDVLIGSKGHCGRSELGRFVQASSWRPVRAIDATAASQLPLFDDWLLLSAVLHRVPRV